MHILQLVPRMNLGGVERGVIDSARLLIAQGHAVSVISAGGPLVKELQETGARHHRLPVDRKNIKSVLGCIPQVTAYIRDERVDIVHARSRVPGWIGWEAANRAQVPFITTAHGYYSVHPFSRVMVWGRYVIAPSESLARYLEDRFKVPPRRLRVIPRGVDLEAFAPQPLREPRWVLGLFGRVTRIKGHAVALRACALLASRGHPIRLRIVGNHGGELEESLRKLADSLDIADRVEWMGVRRDVPAQLAAVDAVCVPSVYPESFGRGVIEAYAVGRPVVASAIGALQELVRDGETGLLAQPGDAQSLAAAVERVMTDAPLRARLAEAGRREAEERWSLRGMVDSTLQVYEECLNKPRVVVWKLSALGDVILVIPTLRALRKHFPESEITLIVGRPFYEIVARCPYVDDIIIVDMKGKDRGWIGRWRILKRLKAGSFDISIDLQNNRWTHLLAWLAGIRTRIGYFRKWGRCLNRPVPLPRQIMPPVKQQLHLLEEVGIAPDGNALELWPDAEDEAAASRLLEPLGEITGPLVGIHPGGSGRWKTKRWAIEHWAALCDKLEERGIRVVITGGPDELALGSEITRLTRSNPLIVIGQTRVLELACLIRRFTVFLGHDSSPLHLAAAMGTPTVALFGPTDPVRHLPPGFKGTVMEREVFCRPCYSSRCRTFTHACMERITVDEVWKTVTAYLPDEFRVESSDERRATSDESSDGRRATGDERQDLAGGEGAAGVEETRDGQI